MQETALTYFQERMQRLGITKEVNRVKLLYQEEINGTKHYHDCPIFEERRNGIFINVFTLDRRKVFYKPKDKKSGRRDGVVNSEAYGITRLEEPIEKPNKDTIKYLIPKGEKVLPFLPPLLLDKYEQKEPIQTLYLTEGYFKAFKASMHGICCVGLTSITALRDKETGKLNDEIHKLIITCNVRHLVWLTDGDCRDITSKEITDGADLYRRPNLFFKTVQTFYDLTSPYESTLRYFAYINSDNIDGKPKGLDDLLCALPEQVEDIKKDLYRFDKKVSQYSLKFHITYGLGEVQRHFMLHDVDVFFLHHVEKRPELKGKEFVFNGTLYYYNDVEGKCIIKVPKTASDYFRVGDKYYQYVKIPNRYGELEQQYHPRQKETIKDDHGKTIFDHIPKYQAFCTVPDHLNYQRVINNCFNAYFPFEHEPEDGECSVTLDFIKHIFGTEPVAIDENTIVSRYELGLDYITLLYKRPQQILPILSLVSNERSTGKTTFNKWLNMIFTENMAIVGNDDLGAQFNGHWSSKLLIACDETKIDKVVVLDKIKSLSTASKIMMNKKGIDQLSMEFFGKFILCSNDEEGFARIDWEEIRFWVIKVPTIPVKNVDLLDELLEEIPAFLYYINQRKMVSQKKERHWFETRLLRTEALEKVMQNSRPNIEKILRIGITELFENSELKEIHIPLTAIAKEIAKKPDDKDYIKRILNQMGYKTEEPARTAYPRLVEKTDINGFALSTLSIGFHGRYYRFLRSDFIKDEPKQHPQSELPF